MTGLAAALATSDAGDAAAQCRCFEVIWLVYVGQSPGEEEMSLFMAKRNACNMGDMDPTVDLPDNVGAKIEPWSQAIHQAITDVFPGNSQFYKIVKNFPSKGYFFADWYRQTQSIARAQRIGANMTLKLQQYSRYGYCEQMEQPPKVCPSARDIA